MDKSDTERLIQWLRDHNHTDADIVDCFEYLATGRKEADNKKNKN